MARLIRVLVVALGAWALAVLPAEASVPRGVLPTPGPVVGAFDPPEVKWGAGHRGVDLAATANSVVVAPAAGVVTYAGVLAGRGVVVVDHGDVRSTFEPVRATVPVGALVAQGQPLGVLQSGHACAAASCLHWGLKRADTYLNPLSMLGGKVVLLSDAEAAAIAARGRG